MKIIEFDDMKIESYKKNYSKRTFWEKIKKIGKKAGIKVIAYAVALYCLLLDKNVPIEDKGMIIGCLGYFISPLDFIPDMLVGVGYTDDIGAMYYIIKKLKNYIDEKTVEKVYKILVDIFDNITYEEIKSYLLS